MKEPQSKRNSPFRIAATRSKGSYSIYLYRRISLSHQQSGDAVSGSEQLDVFDGKRLIQPKDAQYLYGHRDFEKFSKRTWKRMDDSDFMAVRWFDGVIRILQMMINPAKNKVANQPGKSVGSCSSD